MVKVSFRLSEVPWTPAGMPAGQVRSSPRLLPATLRASSETGRQRFGSLRSPMAMNGKLTWHGQPLAVYRSIFGNPATGFVRYEDSKEFFFMQQAEARAEAARDKRKCEDEPKPEVKKVSTGKTDAMLAECSSPEIKFFGKNRLKKMNPPDSGSSAYTEDSPVPNLHHPDFIKKALPPSPAPSMRTAVYSDGESPASSSAGSSAGSVEM